MENKNNLFTSAELLYNQFMSGEKSVLDLEQVPFGTLTLVQGIMQAKGRKHQLINEIVEKVKAIEENKIMNGK